MDKAYYLHLLLYAESNPYQQSKAGKAANQSCSHKALDHAERVGKGRSEFRSFGKR
ncbi:MAG: hypothetical protein JWP69_1045 [Flaviaesturariibacter sp.]|nr:hypothetical protein [Flaviaesturariibacter sp.]